MQQSNAHMTSFKSAFIEIDVTPSITERRVSLQGLWGERERVATEVESALKMQLLLLEDANSSRILLVTADIFAFDPSMVEKINLWVEPWGIAPDALILNASHTHYAPGTLSGVVHGLGEVDEIFRNSICSEIGIALPKLVQSLYSAKVSWTSADIKIGFNRRLPKNGRIEMQPNPNGSYESNTPILLIQTDAGTCLVVNHGCHPTGLGGAAVISSDFVGAFRDIICSELAYPVVPMFLQGAAGNIKHGRLIDGIAKWSKTASETKAIGQDLALKVVKAIEGSLKEVKGLLAWAATDISLPFSQIESINEIASKPENQRYTPHMVKEWAYTLNERYDDGAIPKSMNTRITSVSVGNVALLHWSGEPVTELASNIRNETREYDTVFFAGYTNGLQGYFPTDEMLHEGGYEASRSNFVYLLPAPFKEGVERKLLAGSNAMLKSVKGAAKPLQIRQKDADYQAFFVMSAGRSGTQTLAHLLSPATNAIVLHHPKPDLLKEAQQAYWGEVDVRQCFWRNRSSNINDAWRSGKIYGETDHYMTPFVPTIAEEIPAAKFIVLVRDPREFIRSGMRRSYYTAGNIWDRHRLRPMPQDPEYNQFEVFSSFEKISWLWAETYSRILRSMQKIDSGRIKVMRFEDLINGTEEICATYEFLGLGGYNPTKLEALLGQKLNAQKTGEFPHPSEWSEELHLSCWKHVGKLANYFGYSENYNFRRI